jgi:signal transduction histidine kinase
MSRRVSADYGRAVQGVRRWLRQGVDPVRVDWALAGLLTALAQLAIWVGHDGAHHRVAAAVFAAAITVPIAVRRRAPFVIGTAVPTLSAVDHGLWNGQSVGYPAATFLALYGLAVWTRPRQFAAGAVWVAVADFAATAATGGSLRGTVPFVVVVTGAMMLVRRVVGDRDRRAELAERERDVAAREAVMLERTRIGRELHDVIAHNVSMIVVQAGAERRALNGNGGTTRDVLLAIENTGRGALTEMRRLVGMLRSEDKDALSPQPDLNALPTLVTQMRSAGLPVELKMEGQRRSLPAGIELSGYRIVQEALTNCLKHAGNANATVRVRYAAAALELDITDTGSGTVEHRPGVGHGLIGMRERVALYGGQFDARRQPDGGFTVHIQLPIQ